MSEKTNQELYDKMIEGFNMVLSETEHLKKDSYRITGLAEPAFNNSMTAIDILEQIKTSISGINKRLLFMEKELGRLRGDQR
jgi:hypothetical protein